ncbi:MAG TPA: hypothetical protein VK158_04340 [Acidobacteriota bacterium]|nr:hypothetical protein [Acidobacteriota bacterium]
MAKKKKVIEMVEEDEQPLSFVADTQPSKKAAKTPTKEELIKLQSEVAANNRRFLILVGVMLLLVVGVLVTVQFVTSNRDVYTYDDAVAKTMAGKESDLNYMYRDFVFARADKESLWQTRIIHNDSAYILTSYYSPRELENISIPDYTWKFIIGRKAMILTLASNLDSYVNGPQKAAVGAIEVGKVLGKRYGILNMDTMSAVTADPTGAAPVANCDNVTASTGVIVFQLGNETRISTLGTCVIVQGATPEDLVRASDRLMFHVAGIMNDAAYTLNATTNLTSNVTSNVSND